MHIFLSWIHYDKVQNRGTFVLARGIEAPRGIFLVGRTSTVGLVFSMDYAGNLFIGTGARFELIGGFGNGNVRRNKPKL